MRGAELATLDRLLGTLRPRELEVLRQQFGLGDFEAMPVGQFGETIGISLSRVRQIRQRAIEKMIASAKA